MLTLKEYKSPKPKSKLPLKKFVLELDIECDPDELNLLMGLMVGGIAEKVSEYAAEYGLVCTLGNFRIPK